MFDPMVVLWSVLGVAATIAAGARFWLRSHAPADAALGTLSGHWLAEQRMNPQERR